VCCLRSAQCQRVRPIHYTPPGYFHRDARLNDFAHVLFFRHSVSRKLQQIFIELTLKNEQEEYAREGIEWKKIDFFNNKLVPRQRLCAVYCRIMNPHPIWFVGFACRVVCELIEGSLVSSIRLPPGIFSLLDDVCATMHAESKGSDKAFTEKVLSLHSNHAHLASAGSRIGFVIKHFAGEVEYAAKDFPEKNADSVGNDLILAMQASTKRLIPILFPETVDTESKKKPPTSGFKIRGQTKDLVAHLMSSNPHYIRTIKSNDVKKANFFDFPRVQFQVKYLGLLENLRVRRAGFAYRREFHDFVKRFAILSSKTWPNEYSGSDKDAAKHILSAVKKMRPDLANKEQIQLGKTMLFIKDPETLNEFDQLKLDRLGSMVVKFQRLWRHYRKNKEVVAMKNAVALFLYKAHKERRRESFYRPYAGQYIEGWRKDEELLDLLHHYEKKDSLRVVFIDWITLISSNSSSPMANLREKFPVLFAQQSQSSAQFANWRREDNILLVITKENVFFIQQQSSGANSASPRGRGRTNGASTSAASRAASPTGSAAAAASASFVPNYFLRRMIPLPALASLSLTTFADTFLALHIGRGEASRTRDAPSWRPDKEVDECQECGERFGLFTRKHHCRSGAIDT
jgi:myosin-1